MMSSIWQKWSLLWDHHLLNFSKEVKIVTVSGMRKVCFNLLHPVILPFHICITGNWKGSVHYTRETTGHTGATIV